MTVTPYYDEDGITIYHGDCREVLPNLDDGTVDMVLTDPPYGLDIGYGRTALGLRFIAGDADVALLLHATRSAARLLAPDRWAAVFCGYSQVGQVQNQCAAVGLDVKTVGVWDKGVPTLGEGIRNQYEMFVLARKGKPAERWCGGNVWKARDPGRPDHPHQKPLRLVRTLVEHYSEPGSLLLDPCRGSGTTLRAAKDCRRRAIGIEIDEAYCELAATRLAQGVLNLAGGAA